MIRGRVLRDTNAGPGVVSINGEQKEFTLEGHWFSDVPPKVGGMVDVELDTKGLVTKVINVNDSTLAKEQAERALGIAKKKGTEAFGILLSRVGASTLGAIAVLAVAWLFLSAINVQIAGDHKASITFYDILKLLNSGRSLDAIQAVQFAGAGFYGFLMFVALLAPLAAHFHGNKYLTLTYCAPLFYMLAVILGVYLNVRSQVSQARGLVAGLGGAQGAAFADQMLSEMMTMAMKAISFGVGFYIAVALTLYLAAAGVKKFLVSNT